MNSTSSCQRSNPESAVQNAGRIHRRITAWMADQVVKSQLRLVNHDRRAGRDPLGDGAANDAGVIRPMTDAVPHGVWDLLLLQPRTTVSLTPVFIDRSSELASLAPSWAFRTLSGALRYSATLFRSVTKTYSPWRVAMRKRPFLAFLVPSLTMSTGRSMNLMAAIHDGNRGIVGNPTPGTLG